MSFFFVLASGLARARYFIDFVDHCSRLMSCNHATVKDLHILYENELFCSRQVLEKKTSAFRQYLLRIRLLICKFIPEICVGYFIFMQQNGFLAAIPIQPKPIPSYTISFRSIYSFIFKMYRLIIN